MTTRTDAERAVFKRGEWERIADLHPGVLKLLYSLQRRLDAIRDHKPRHAIVPLDGHCAVCGVEVYESFDYRGGRYRHEEKIAYGDEPTTESADEYERWLLEGVRESRR